MPERIVSLAPSATGVVRALGADGRLVAGTDHGYDGPSVGGWLTPDMDAIDAHDPDLVLTTDDLQEGIATELLERGVDTAHFAPRTLSDAYDYVRGIGDAIGMSDRAVSLATDMERRIGWIRERASGRGRPVVYCEEWDDPPMVAGNWVPEIVEAAGGRYPFCEPGERSRRIDPMELDGAMPDCAVLHICGRGSDVDCELLEERGWEIDPVYVMDDNLLNQPGPHLVEATERMARLLHPDAMTPPHAPM